MHLPSPDAPLPPAAGLGTGPRSWPVDARAEQLAEIVERYSDATCRGVVLTGRLGVGRTWLAEAVAQALEARRQAPVLRIVGSTALRSVPFGTLHHLLPVPPDAPGGERVSGLFEVRAAELVEERRGTRLVVVLDDLERVDLDTVALIERLCKAGSAFVVATSAPDLSSGPAGGSGTAGLEVLAVEPLGRASVESLVQRALAGPVSVPALEALWAISEGVPLILREVLDEALRTGSLATTGAGVWHLAAPLPITPRLIEGLGPGVLDLAPPLLDVLRLVAVAGELLLEDVERCARVQEVEQLREAGLLEPAEAAERPGVRFARPIDRALVWSRVGRLAGRRLSDQVLDLVAARRAPSADDLVLAVVLELDLGRDPGARRCAAAAAHAHASGDLLTTLRLAEAALAATESLEVRQLLAEACTLLGLIDRAEQVVEQAHPPSVGAGDAAQRAWVDLQGIQLHNLLWCRADLDRTRAFLQRERGDAPGTQEALHLRLREGELLELSGDPLAALGTLADAASWPPVVASSGLASRARCLLAIGRTQAALDDARRSVELLSSLRERTVVDLGQPVASLARALLAVGQAAEAERTLLDAVEASSDRPVAGARAVLLLTLGEVLLARGRLDEARRWSSEAVLSAEVAGSRVLRATALGQVASAVGQLGDVTAAAALRAELLALPAHVALRSPEVASGLAWTAAALGQLAEARGHAQRAAFDRHRAGAQRPALELLTVAARLGAATEVRHEVAALARQVEGELASAWATYVAASAVAAPAELAAAEHELAAGSWTLLAAETATMLAAAQRRAGDGRSAVAAHQRARALAARCDDAATPVLRTVDAVAPLSAREQEVTRLAAGGLSNAEIAERLGLSVRTVGNHLQNAYVKLGASGRHELAGRFGGPRVDR